MNNCVIELRGEVKNIIKFMAENINFVHVDNNGVKFTTEINFGRIVKELDEDAMKELYGVPVSIPVKYLKVDVHKAEGDYYDPEDYEDNRPYDLYDFKIYNVGDMNDNYFNIEYKIFDGQCFRDRTHAQDKRKFINDFFDKFAGLRKCYKEDMRVLDDWMWIEFEVPVYDIPVNVTEAWREEYDVVTNVVYSDENKVIEYYRYPNCDRNVEFTLTTPENNMLKYTEKLLQHKWANIHVMFDNFCNMLYDMKDKIPFEIDLEPQEKGRRYKYNKFYGDLSQMFYSLARTDYRQLAKIYVTVGETFDKLFDNKISNEIKLPDGREDLF